MKSKLKKNRRSKIGYLRFSSSCYKKIRIWRWTKFSSCWRERTFCRVSSSRYTSKSSRLRRILTSNPITQSAKKPSKNKKINFSSKNSGFSTKTWWTDSLPVKSRKYPKNRTHFVSKWIKSKQSTTRRKKRIKRTMIRAALVKNQALVQKKT